MNGLLKKAALGLTLGATALTAAAPADAQWRGRYGGGWHRHHGGNAAGAAVLGGIVGLGLGAAIASSNRPYRGGYYGGGYYGGGGYYDRGYDPYYAPPRAYYYEDYRPRCWTDWRWDPYWGRNVRVRVCN